MSIILIILGVWLLFFELGLAPIDRSEGRIAEVVREMNISKDYFHPTCLGIPYITKPMIPYWLDIAVVKVRGALDEFSLRFSSALAALLAVLAVFYLGSTLFSRKAGFVSAVILLTCFGFISWGRCAAPDMLSLSAIIISIAWYRHFRDNPAVWNVFVFGLILAFAGHMKGLVGIVIPLMVAGIDLLITRSLGVFLRPVILASFLTGLCLYLVPFAASSLSGPVHGYNWLYMAVHESITRTVKPFDHRGSVFMYVYFIPIWMLPWTPLFLGKFFQDIFQIRRLKPRSLWLMLSFLAILALFTAAGSRRSYYILPVLPFCALICGSVIETKDNNTARFQGGLLLLQAAFFLFLGLAVSIVSIAAFRLPALPFPAAFFRLVLFHGLLLTISSAAYFFFFKRNKQSPFLLISALLLSGVITTGGFICFEKPYFDRMATEKPFMIMAGKLVLKEPDAIPVSFRIGTRARTRLNFYLNPHVPIENLKDGQKPADFLAGKEAGFVFCERENRSELVAMLSGNQLIPRIVLEEQCNEWEGWPDRHEISERGKLLLLKVERQKVADR